MDRKYYWPMDSYLTPEQILHEENGLKKIRQLYGMSEIGFLGTYICVGAATFLALKRRGLRTEVFVPTLTATPLAAPDLAESYVRTVSVFLQMIVIS